MGGGWKEENNANDNGLIHKTEEGDITARARSWHQKAICILKTSTSVMFNIFPLRTRHGPGDENIF